MIDTLRLTQVGFRKIKLNFSNSFSFYFDNSDFNKTTILTPNSIRVTKLIKYSRRYNEKITLTDT